MKGNQPSRLCFPLLSVAFGLLLLGLTSCANVPSEAPDPPQPPGPLRVLLLGDSISMGYTPVVKELLGERAFVMRARKMDKPEKSENCQGTNFGVQHLDRWLAQGTGRWDVIHFNFGLHDLKRVHPDTGKNSSDPNDPYQADPARYETQLRQIVERLKQTDARLIFATTTPVPEGVRPYRAPSDAPLYNGVAKQVMRDHGVEVNDLFAFAQPRLAEIQNPNDVHFTKEGSRALGEQVARTILAP